MKQGGLQSNRVLAKFTTWRVGGPGDLVLIPRDINELSEVVNAYSTKVPITLIGLGSNVLIQDGGIRGLTVVMQGGGLNAISLHDNDSVVAEAGVACGQLARYLARNGLVNAEFLAGIPGTVGGALSMNAGCYGGETWDLVSEVLMMASDGQTRWRHPDEFKIGYRTVIKPVDNELFIAAKLKLAPGDKTTSLATIKRLLAQRNQAQPTSLPNCGSVFRNPPGRFAAQLIEAVGLKGHRIGGAEISTKHANFIVNVDAASAKDILALITVMKSEVLSKYNIKLEQEVKVIGEAL